MKAATTILFFCVAALLALGMVMLVSASTGQAEARYLVMQPIWGALGLAACGLAAMGDYRWLQRFRWVPWAVLGLALVLLGSVWAPGVGLTRNGATRWLGMGAWRVQPSEFAKIALIIVLAHYCSRNFHRMHTLVWGVILPSLLIAPVLALVFKEPDWGTTLLLASVSGVMILVAGAKAYFLAIPGLAGLVALVWVLLNNPLRLIRLLAFLHPELYREGAGYQVYQGVIALGVGGLTGLGLGNGRQKLGFVPEHHTDFIFSVIGEELGLVATVAVVLAFLTIVICGLYIAWNACDTFGLLLATGITSLIGLQAAINIGVVTGSLPNKGLPLPFISYGGSNLVMMLAAVGLLLNVARHAGEVESLPEPALETSALQPS